MVKGLLREEKEKKKKTKNMNNKMAINTYL